MMKKKNLELGDHGPLHIVRDRPFRQKTLRQVVFVISLKHVLVLNKAEEHDGLFKEVVNIFLALTLEPLFQHVVDEQRNTLWRLGVEANEFLEAL